MHLSLLYDEQYLPISTGQMYCSLSILMTSFLIYSKDKVIHLQYLTKVLHILRENKLFGKKRKCAFAQSEVEFLGHHQVTTNQY